MITEEQLKEVGFKNDGITKSPFTGRLCRYHLYKDNGHIIPGHDCLNIYLNLDNPFVTVEIEHQSSYTHTKEIAFKGKCTDIELFKKILTAVCGYYG
jgi:hypothetical protein